MPEAAVGERGGSRAARLLLLAAVVLLALNLRPTAVSVGPVLDDVRAGLGLAGWEAGLLTSLPVIAFALVGSVASRLAARVGPHRLTALALACVVVGLLGRAVAEVPWAFLLLSFLALSGMAASNVVLPSLVKRHYPDRVGSMTAVYSTALAVGLTGASVLTVPVADAAGSWRAGLGVWAAVAGLALVPWLGLLGRDRVGAAGAPATGASIALREVARTRLGRLMALFFGLQSLQAYAVFGWFAAIYRDAGFSAGTAGLLLGVVTGVSIPLSFLVPTLAGRLRSTAPLVWGLSACYPVGYLGLAVAPHDLALLWAVVVGVGSAIFPLVLTLIGLRARTPEGTAALSGFTQSAGYLLAAVGPFGVGVLHDASGGWTLPLVVLAALAVPQLLVGLAVSSPAAIEDELTARV